MSWPGVFLSTLLMTFVLGYLSQSIVRMIHQDMDTLIQNTLENTYDKKIDMTKQPFVPNFKIGLISESEK